jgi:hypothetical protein
MAQTLMLVSLVAMSYNESESEYVQRHAFSGIFPSIHKSGMMHILGAGLFHLQLAKLSRRGTCVNSFCGGTRVLLKRMHLLMLKYA